MSSSPLYCIRCGANVSLLWRGGYCTTCKDALDAEREQ